MTHPNPDPGVLTTDTLRVGVSVSQYLTPQTRQRFVTDMSVPRGGAHQRPQTMGGSPAWKSLHGSCKMMRGPSDPCGQLACCVRVQPDRPGFLTHRGYPQGRARSSPPPQRSDLGFRGQLYVSHVMGGSR